MRAGLKLGAYGLALAAVLGVGAAVGAAAGPIDVGENASHSSDGHDADDSMNESGELPAGGLMVAQDGYRFMPEDRLADGGDFTFTIVGPDGHPVTAYGELHDRELHLIVASRDLREYVHVHPVRDSSGRWTAELPSFAPGSYRAFADFQPAGESQYTLGVDLVAPGATAAMAPLEEQLTDAVSGYDVTLTADGTAEGSDVTITVRRDGDVVTTDPYLGAAGHLVALRDGDLAYVHVHPLDEEPVGPVRFALELPSEGQYALFFDFKVDGAVHTARFVLDVAPPSTDDHDDDEH